MKKGTDCDVFHDQLDALKAGSLSDEGLDQLRVHGGCCPDCAESLRVHEHLSAKTIVELEAAVPADLLASVWPRVEAELSGRRSGRVDGRRTNWLIPAMAAATVVLAIATGLLFTELTKVRERERVLARTVSEQQQWLAELDERTSVNTSVLAAGLAGRGWARALSRREQMSVADLSDLLQRLPARATILTASQAEELSSAIPVWAPPAFRSAIGEIDMRDGIRAGDLLRILESLELDPDVTLRTSRIIGLFRG